MAFHQGQAPSNRSEIDYDDMGLTPQASARNLAEWTVLEQNCRMIVGEVYSLCCRRAAKRHLHLMFTL